MKTIYQLPAEEAQKIAAGEVIERPAHIVKELVENALDSGATIIYLDIVDAGKSLIRVADNGSGMIEDDAHACFLRHTTSKLRSFSDIQKLHTFGFRGEALASICSVARVTLYTQHKDAKHGIKLKIINGAIQERSIIAQPPGTIVHVEDLFYSVPVRKKFLKTTTTEWNQIISLFKAFTLYHFNTTFTLKHNNSVVFSCPAVNTLFDRANQLFEQQFIHNLLIIPTQTEKELTLSGIITNHQYTRYDRTNFFFFVNGRWIKNYQLGHALYKGYTNVLPPGKYPAAVLKIEIDPSLIDINVHPKKEEVLFVTPRHVEQLITKTIRTTLEQSLSEHLKKNISFKKQSSMQPIRDPFFSPSPLSTQSMHIPYQNETQESGRYAEPHAQSTIIPKSNNNRYHYLGQLHKTYLLFEQIDGLFIIDQHAAHERILYERFEHKEQLPAIPLMFPHIIELSDQDMKTIRPHLALFDKYGIQIELQSKTHLVIKATPATLTNQPFEEIIQNIISTLYKHHTVDQEKLMHILTGKIRAMMACKAALKAGDLITNEEVQELLDDLFKTPNRFTCPHGRPTSWLIEKHKLEKSFKRIR